MDLDVQQPRERVPADESRRAALLAAFEASGLTQQAFAHREGINYHTFVSWLVQHRRAAEAVSAQGGRVTPASSAQVTDTTHGRLEVSLPGKIVVRGDAPATVA